MQIIILDTMTSQRKQYYDRCDELLFQKMERSHLRLSQTQEKVYKNIQAREDEAVRLAKESRYSNTRYSVVAMIAATDDFLSTNKGWRKP